MKEQKLKKYVNRLLLFCLCLSIVTLPTFADEAADMNDVVGEYMGTIFHGNKGALVDVSVQKISTTTGFVTIKGLGNMNTPQKFYMTFKPDLNTVRLYNEDVTSDGEPLWTKDYIFEGYCGNDMMTGNHGLYGLDEDGNLPEESFVFFKNTSSTLTLSNSDLNRAIDLPGKLIDADVAMSSLNDTRISFYEYNPYFFSMSLSFTAETPETNYYYMMSLPEDSVLSSISKSPVSLNAASYQDDFGQFVATTLPGDLYGPLKYISLDQETKLEEQYKSSILNHLGEDTILGHNYNLYDSYAGILSGHDTYELQIMFSGTLESFLETLETNKASLYIGCSSGELLMDGFRPIEDNWRELLNTLKADSNDSVKLDNQYIKHVSISSIVSSCP